MTPPQKPAPPPTTAFEIDPTPAPAPDRHFRIEPILPHDYRQLEALFREFAEFEKLPHRMVNSAERMAREVQFLQGFVVRAADTALADAASADTASADTDATAAYDAAAVDDDDAAVDDATSAVAAAVVPAAPVAPAAGSAPAHVSGEIVGYVTFFFAYYTWTGKSLYMDDLYVRPGYRGRGLGTRLVSEVIGFARANGCHKLRWQVSDWNAPAIGFYRSLGAAIDDVERNCDLYFT